MDPKLSQAPTEQPEKIAGYDTGADKYTARRMRQFLTWVLLPILVFCGGGWYLLVGRPASEQSGILGAPKSTPTRYPTRGISGDTVLGGSIQVNPTVGATAPATSSAAVALVPNAPRIICYARIDTHALYTNTVVLANGLFYAEGFSRVNGGMIWSTRFGWYPLSDFGCQAGLENLEMEFAAPTLTPTQTPTRKPVIVPTRAPTAIPSATPAATQVPTITPSPGILLFDIWDCHDVRWLAWGVDRVYLTVGSTRSGVAGDDRGQPVHQDLCSASGQKVRLDAFKGSTQFYREGVLP